MIFNKPTIKLVAIIAAACAAIVFIIIIINISFFGAPQKTAEPERFTIGLNDTNKQITDNLKTREFIKNSWAFNFALGWKGISEIKPGGYKISKSMNIWEMVKIFSQEPYMEWVVIPEGLRKEEIADILAKNLGWSNEEKNNWLTIDTATKSDYIEGVYFPDTYLIPRDESTSQVAGRLISKFQEKFATLSKEAIKQNIKWTTVIKFASIIQRESAKNDKQLIAGILWNRLLQGMKLGVDATVQYARGKVGQSWWGPLKSGDTKIDSPYNTYLHSGLPPHPIANPGFDAIYAVLYPTKTDCLFYLHDSDKIIHCAKTYKEHLQNIDKYLR